MTRKPLPKVITRTSADLRGIAAAVGGEAVHGSHHAAFDRVEPEPTATVSAPASATTAAPRAVKDLRPVAATPTEPHAAKRRALARKIVNRHRNYAVLGGLVPLPVVSIASLTAINMRMVKRLSDLYGAPFQRDRTRSLIVGIVGGAVPAGLGSATSATLMLVVPGGMLAGIGVSAVTAAALTRGIGLVFIDSFESDATGRDAA